MSAVALPTPILWTPGRQRQAWRERLRRWREWFMAGEWKANGTGGCWPLGTGGCWDASGCGCSFCTDEVNDNWSVTIAGSSPCSCQANTPGTGFSRVTTGSLNGTYTLTPVSGSPCLRRYEVSSGGPVTVVYHSGTTCSNPVATFTDLRITLQFISGFALLNVVHDLTSSFAGSPLATFGGSNSRTDCNTTQSGSNQYTTCPGVSGGVQWAVGGGTYTAVPI